MQHDDHLDGYAGRDRAMAALGISVVQCAQGEAVTALRATEAICDERDVVSHGSVFTLADAAIALASNSYGPPALLVHADAVWYSEAPIGAELTARCAVVQRTDGGDSTFESRVTAADGSLIAIVWGTTRSPR